MTTAATTTSTYNNKSDAPRPLKQRVRFNDVVSELCQVPRVENKHDVWYTKAEFLTIAKDVRSTIKRLRKNTLLIACLEEAFQFSLSVAGNLVDEYDEETALTRIRSHQSLTCWTGEEQQLSYRGLENLSSQIIRCHSHVSREFNARLGDFAKTGKTDEEDVQRVCATNSRCARIFARLLAECDASAAAAVVATNAERPCTPELDESTEEEEEEEEITWTAKKLRTMSGVQRVLQLRKPRLNKTECHTRKTTFNTLPICRKRRAMWTPA